MDEFRNDEQISRQQAAERLTDIAYALTVGGTLEVRTSGARVDIPVADEVRLTRKSTSQGDRVEVRFELSWSGSRKGCDDGSPSPRGR